MSAFQYIGSRITSLKIKNDFVDLFDSNEVKKSIDVSHEILSIEKDKQKYNISMSIEGCFTAPDEIGEELFKKMLQINGITSLYSIARGFIQSTTSQTLMTGNVLLPMFNVAQYSRDLNEQNEEEQAEDE